MFTSNLSKYLNTDQIESIISLVIKAKRLYDIDDHFINILEIKFNKRLRTASGVCKYFYDDSRCEISLNPKILNKFGFNEIISTFAHELAHFVEFSLYQQSGHSKRFKEICKNLGGSMNKYYATGEYSECKSENYIVSEYKWHYKCSCNYLDFKFKRRALDRNNRRCPKCKETLDKIERRI